MALGAPVGPEVGPDREDPDSRGQEGAETHPPKSARTPNREQERGWDHLGYPPGQLDLLSLERALEDVGDDEEVEEEASPKLAPRERLCWSREVVSHLHFRWAHRSLRLDAAAADEAAVADEAAAADAAAAAAAAAAWRFVSDAKLAQADGS